MAQQSVSPTTLIRSTSPDVPERDLLAREEPLEIRLEFGPENDRQSIRLAVTMRTPGNDPELVRGFLFTEGIIDEPEELLNVRYCEDVKEEEKENVVRAFLAPHVAFDPSLQQRNFYTTSSCGVCGKSSIEAVELTCNPVVSDLRLNEKDIHKGPGRLRESQRVFRYTGGLHAAGLFDASGNLLRMHEDVGRHNALDKLIGTEWGNGDRLREGFVLLSGRAGFELVQKAARAKIPVLAAVGAPSSLAAELAERVGITLLGFVRNDSFNCYSHTQRIRFT